MGDADLTYRVLYTKSSTKKRKTYQDGTLLLTSSYIVLIGDDGKDVCRKKCHMPKVTSGEEITLGTFELQIEEVVNKSSISQSSSVPISSVATIGGGPGYVTHTSRSFPATPVPSASSKKSKVDNLQAQQKLAPKIFISKSSLPSYKAAPVLLRTAVASSETLSSVSSNTSNTLVGINSSSRGISDNMSRSRIGVSGNTNNIAQEIALDTALLRVMRPHQIEAANFLIRRLLGENSEDKCLGGGSDLKTSSVSTSSLSSSDKNKKIKTDIDKTKQKVEKSKQHPVKGRRSGISRNKMTLDSDSDSFNLSDSDIDSNSDICDKNTTRNKIKDKRRNYSSYKSRSSRSGCNTNIDSDSDSDDNCNSDKDSDSDGMFVEKPPGYIDEVEKDVAPSGTFTGAILADEVLLFFSPDHTSNIIYYEKKNHLHLLIIFLFYLLLFRFFNLSLGILFYPIILYSNLLCSIL